MATVFERVQILIVEQLGMDSSQIVPAANFVEDLDADSLDLVELIMSMEEEFSHGSVTLEIADDEAEKIHTVQDAVDFIEEMVGKGKAVVI